MVLKNTEVKFAGGTLSDAQTLYEQKFNSLTDGKKGVEVSETEGGSIIGKFGWEHITYGWSDVTIAGLNALEKLVSGSLKDNRLSILKKNLNANDVKEICKQRETIIDKMEVCCD